MTAATNSPVRNLRIAYTPDSDDAFTFYAWEHGRVTLDGMREQRPEFHRHHIATLNRAASQEQYDVVAVSSAYYPRVADRYWILTAGNSVGRGWGPVLASKKYTSVNELRGKRVAVGGMPTTGSTLALMYCPGASLVEMPYDRIADAIASDEIDAGVMIHEELLYFPEKGLHRVCDFGEAWLTDTGLPLPVGLNLVRQGLGRPLAAAIAAACRCSLVWGLEHSEEAFAFAGQFGRGQARKHVAMFSNQDTADLKPDVRQALRIMFDRAAELGLGPRLTDFEIIEP